MTLPLLARALLRFVRRTPWSAAMALGGVALGVTSIVAVHLISAQLVQRMDALVPSALSEYNFVATRDTLRARDFFALQRAWLDGEVPGVEGLAPFIHESRASRGGDLTVIGVDLFDTAGEFLDAAQAPLAGDGDTPLALSGVWLSTPDTTIVADPDGLPDAAALVQAQRELVRGRPINGYLALPAGTIVGDIGTAQALLGWQEDRLSYVGLRAQQTRELWFERIERLAPGFRAGLPAAEGPELPGWRVQPLLQQHPASAFGKSVLFNVSALGMLALVVAWLLIYQVAVAWLRRLWGVFMRLHVLGVSRAGLCAWFLGLLAVLGLLAAVAGLYLGSALAGWLLGIVVPDLQTPGVDAWVVMKAVGSALGVCLLGGWWAFATHARQTTFRRRSSALAIGLCLLVMVPGILSDATGLVGSFVSIGALAAIVALVIPVVLRELRARSGHLRAGLLWRMSLRDVLWHPRDLAVALSGLTLAIATAMGVGVMVDSFRADFSSMLERRLTYDTQITGPANELQTLVTELRSRPLSRMQTYHEMRSRVGDLPVTLVSTRLDAFETARYGYTAPLAGNEVLVSEQLARTLGLGPGSMVSLGEKEARVAGVFQSFGDIAPRIIVPWSLPGATLREIRFNGALDETFAAELRTGLPQARWRPQQGVRELALATFDQTFAITSVLIGIAVMVAGIGVYIAVTVMRLNQQASQRLLQGMGILAGERLRIDLYRGLGMGGICCLLALPVGLAMGWILCAVVNPRAFGWWIDMVVAPGALLAPVAWGMLAATLAGLLRVGGQEEGQLVAG